MRGMAARRRLLIAGAGGFGREGARKSVCLRLLVTELLAGLSPSELPIDFHAVVVDFGVPGGGLALRWNGAGAAGPR